jgi:hypothetical protein
VAALGDIIRTVKKERKASLGDLTVLSNQNDPFRFDTKTGHRNAQWLRDMMRETGLLHRENPIHKRGLHYAIFSLGTAINPKTGVLYKNDEADWLFLSNEATRAALFLQYVDFEKIIDARNEEPIVREFGKPNTTRWHSILGGGRLEQTDVYIRPWVAAFGYEALQPYHIVLTGEKTSLAEVLEPLAYRYDADLYLPSGEMSDSMLYRMAKTGAEDGRPMAVFVFADCDPAGYQMSVSIAHKLRAFKEGWFPDLDFRVLAPGLTVDQVREFALPSTPLKETEKRADGWREKYGVEQTEIDALATLQPEVLRKLARAAIEPYYDATLDRRLREAKAEWQGKAQAILDQHIDQDTIDAVREEVNARLAEARERLETFNEEIGHIHLTGLPEKVVPEPIILPEKLTPPLVSSDMDFLEHVRVLRDRKDYGGQA